MGLLRRDVLSRARSRRLLPLLVVLLALPTALAENESKLAGKVACVYPISGQYGAIVRWTYYTLLLFGIIAQREIWLIAGALATAMSYSATTAIHAVILSISTAHQPVFDLDLVGAWAVIAAGAFALWPVLGTSRTLIESPFRPIFTLWACVMCAGAIAASAPIYLSYPKEPMCNSTLTGQLLQYPYQVGQPGFQNCTYTCFDSRRVLRAPSEIQAVDARIVFGARWNAYTAMAGYCVNASVIIVLLSTNFGWYCHQWSERRKQRKHPDRTPRPYYRTMSLLHPRNRGERIGVFFFFLNEGCALVSIALMEYHLLGSSLPLDEAPYGISQWGGAVSIAIVIFAAGMNKYNQWRDAQRSPSVAEDPEAARSEDGLPAPGLDDASPVRTDDNGTGTPSRDEKAEEPKEPSPPRRSLQVRETFGRVPTLPIREVRTGWLGGWDKLRSFLRFLGRPPPEWQPPAPRRQPPRVLGLVPAGGGRRQ